MAGVKEKSLCVWGGCISPPESFHLKIGERRAGDDLVLKWPAPLPFRETNQATLGQGEGSSYPQERDTLSPPPLPLQKGTGAVSRVDGASDQHLGALRSSLHETHWVTLGQSLSFVRTCPTGWLWGSERQKRDSLGGGFYSPPFI